MVEFLCFEKQGNNCTRPEVAFWTRTKKARKEDLRKGQDLIKDLCVKPKAFLDKLHAVGNYSCVFRKHNYRVLVRVCVCVCVCVRVCVFAR